MLNILNLNTRPSIKPKLTFYKQEIDRRKRVIEDSLKQIELKKLEETKSDSSKQSIIPNEDVKEDQPQVEEKLKIENDEDMKRKEMEENELRKSDLPIDIKEPDKPKSDKIK
ncbi:MAG: hypothetical protein MZV64_20255 [Ignavibacteriales bacterium]|nr:hypothetical protein [Ignavibacteriales bacterium]